MIEDYLEKSKELFAIDTIPDIERAPVYPPLVEGNRLKTIEDDSIKASISHQVENDANTYTVHARLCNIVEKMFGEKRDLKLQALHNYFSDNQECINNCVSRILKQWNIYNEPSQNGIYLGNGRLFSSSGLFFIYHTNVYNYSTDPSFKNLVKEEMDIVTACLSVVYALLGYVRDVNPEPKTIDKISQTAEIMSPVKSDLVHKYVNEKLTMERNPLFFSEFRYQEKGHQELRKAEAAREKAMTLDRKFH